MSELSVLLSKQKCYSVHFILIDASMTSNFIVQLKVYQHASVYKQKLFKHTKGYTYRISVLNALRYYRAFNKWVLSQGNFNQDMYIV